jgi:succinylglutamate desuccinylase
MMFPDTAQKHVVRLALAQLWSIMDVRVQNGVPNPKARSSKDVPELSDYLRYDIGDDDVRPMQDLHSAIRDTEINAVNMQLLRRP